MNASLPSTLAPAPLAPHTAKERLVVIAASAGGIPALQRILPSIPEDFPASIVIVLHRTESRESLLAAILQRVSRLPVKNITPGEVLRQGTIYVAPATMHVYVNVDHTVSLLDGQRISRVLSSADPLFESAAAAYGDGAIAVVLTGMGRNGASGVLRVREAGGTVIAQDRQTSAHFAMPAAAIATGAVSRVLPIDEIGPTLVHLVANGKRP